MSTTFWIRCNYPLVSFGLSVVRSLLDKISLVKNALVHIDSGLILSPPAASVFVMGIYQWDCVPSEQCATRKEKDKRQISADKQNIWHWILMPLTSDNISVVKISTWNSKNGKFHDLLPWNSYLSIWNEIVNIFARAGLKATRRCCAATPLWLSVISNALPDRRHRLCGFFF